MPEKRKTIYDSHHRRFADYVIDNDGKGLIEYKVDSVVKSIPLEKLKKAVQEAQKKMK